MPNMFTHNVQGFVHVIAKLNCFGILLQSMGLIGIATLAVADVLSQTRTTIGTNIDTRMQINLGMDIGKTN